jgi:uncharacterized protein YeaC (DUF1315 family)
LNHTGHQKKITTEGTMGSKSKQELWNHLKISKKEVALKKIKKEKRFWI